MSDIRPSHTPIERGPVIENLSIGHGEPVVHFLVAVIRVRYYHSTETWLSLLSGFKVHDPATSSSKSASWCGVSIHWRIKGR